MSLIVFEGSHGAGKSTIIKNMEERYDLISLKSVPDWYRKYIPFARSLEPEVQKQVYLIGHEANYESLENDKDYIFDRFFYTTIIRLNYELGKTREETVEEIFKISMFPDLVINLYTDKETMINRLTARGDPYLFDINFYIYENEVYRQLSDNSDKIVSVGNDNNIDYTINEIENCLQKNKVLLRRR